MDNPCDIGTKAKNRKMRPLLETDASGPFFDDAPMKYFGSTPIAYFAVFGMKDLLEELVGCPKKVEEAQVKAEFAATLLPPAQRSRFNEARDKARDKNKSTFDGAPMPQRMPSPLSEPERYYLVNELRCKCTGYLPIHAVAASDNKVMYDFMVDICGANDKLEVEELSALKLSVVLGKQAMVKHILKRRLVTAWVWGPVIQYMIPLDEIDTAGERLHRDDHLSKKFDQRCLGNMQLLELVVAPNAKEVTRQMMLDSFMNGFFFKLIQLKWGNNAQYWYWTNVSIHLFFTLQLTYLAAPSILDPRLAEPIASELNSSQLLIAVFLSLFILEEELREIVLWLYVRKLRFTWKEMWFATHGRGIALGELLDCMLLRRSQLRLPMALLTIIAALIEMQISILNGNIVAGNGNQGDLMSQVRTLEEWPNICLAFAVACAWWLLMLDAFQWSEDLGVFSAMVLKMLSSDILSKFLPLYVPILLGFTTSMHVIYPQKTTHDSRWSSWWQTLESLVLFSLVGEAPDIASNVEGTGDFHPIDMLWSRHFQPEFSEGVTRSAFSAVCFVFLYVMFLFVVLLLLVNLLIAMMSSTYERERESARLQWRVLFARLVLRYELLNMPLAITDPMRHEQRVMVGDSTMGKSEYFLFRSYDKGAQLNLDGEGGDLFADGDGKGDEAPAAADSAEVLQQHVEAVASRTAEMVLERLGLAASTPITVDAKHAIDPRALASHLGGLPLRKATSDMEGLIASAQRTVASVQRSANRAPLLPLVRGPPPLKLAHGYAACGVSTALPPPSTPALGEGDWPSSMQQLCGHQARPGVPPGSVPVFPATPAAGAHY